MSLLYKFVADPQVVRFFLEGAIKFTPVHELNDPSELVPQMLVPEVVTSLERLRRDGYSPEDMVHLREQGALLQKLAPQRQVIPVPRTKEEAAETIRSSFYDSTDTLGRLLNDTAREISSKVGLFCLSRRYDSLPMWAHYSANASGIAIELMDLEQVFSGDETGILSRLVPVRYEREHFGITFDPCSHRHLFFTKFQDWRYEEEVRVVMPLTECRPHRTSPGVSYLYDIPQSCISRILLGWNITANQAAAVRGYVQAINSAVEVVQARFVRGRIQTTSFETHDVVN